MKFVEAMPRGVVQPGEHGHLIGRARYPHSCACSACATDWWDAHSGWRKSRSKVARSHGGVGQWAMGCRCDPCVAAWDEYVAAGGGLEWGKGKRREKR
jgi:hypothetical protein